MISLLIISSGAICLLIIYTKQKTLFCVSGIFVLMWSICLTFASFGLYGMNKPIPIVFFLGCMSMFIFSLVGSSKTKVASKTKIAYLRMNTIENKSFSLCYVLNLVAYIFSFPYLKKSIDLIISTGNLDLIRENAFNASAEYATTAVLTIFQTIIAPLFLVTILLAAIDILSKKKHKILILMALIDVIIYTVMFAGRYMLLQLLLFVFFASYDKFSGNVFKFFRRQKKVIFFSVIMLLALVYMTLQRSSSSSFFKSLYTYFCGSFAYLSYLIENQIGTDLYLMGATQFGFFTNFVSIVLKVLFNVPVNGSSYRITQLTQYMVPIGGNIKYNSLATMLHDFMADYGLYGCLFGVLIFAFFCNQIEIAKKRSNSLFVKAFYIYILYTVVNSVFSYSFRGADTLMIIVFLWLFTRKRIDPSVEGGKNANN